MQAEQSKMSLAKILRFILSVCMWLVTIAVTLLVLFSLSAQVRERKSSLDIAPNTGRFIVSNKTKIFIQEAGPENGQPVVLIHGTGAWSEIWRETMTALANEKYHVVTIDMPPFGYSEKLNGPLSFTREEQAKRISGVIDALHLKNTILVGHSIGARPVMELVLDEPEKISKLVLVDPALGFYDDKNLPPDFEQNKPGLITKLIFMFKPVRNSILSSYATNPLFTKIVFSSFVSRKDSVTDNRTAMLQQPMSISNTTNSYSDWLEYIATYTDNSTSSDFSKFKEVQIPTLLIWGETDDITPLWQSEKLLKLIPHSTLSVIDGVGHIPYIENTNEFNSTLIKFIKQ